MTRRGELWFVDFGEPIGHEQGYQRPAVIVSSDHLNTGPSGLVIVVPITTTRRQLPAHVEIEPGQSGLTKVSYAKAEDVTSISKDRLMRQIGMIPIDRLGLVDRALRLILELG